MKQYRFALATSLVGILLTACGGAQGPGPGDPLPLANQVAPQVGPTPPERAAASETLPLASARGPLAAGSNNDGGYTVDTASREQVRLFYKTIHASSNGVPSGWAGDVGACVAGNTSAAHKGAVLRRLNWYRAMAGVPASVTFDPTLNAKAQEAALWMAANQTINHFPPSGTPCYSATVALAAGKSNLAYGTFGVTSISAYIEDGGANNAVVGHRRWLLYPQTQLMGLGDIESGLNYNTVFVQDGNLFGPRPATRDGFVAWPPRGYVPYNEVYPRWSISYPNANFSGATVTMLENGTPIATVKEALVNGYGENTLVWRPAAYPDNSRWAKPASDTTYTITIGNVTGAGVPTSFSYTTTVFDPDKPGTGDGPINLLTSTGSATAEIANPTTFVLNPVPGATGYEWRTLTSSSLPFNDGAESGPGNFTFTTTSGYNPITNETGAGSESSFHLAHVRPVDQVMLLNSQLVAGPGATLQFDSRLGLSTSAQRAIVEISIDDGVSWVGVYDQAGSGFGETVFTPKTISLAPYVNRVLKVRFRYAMSSGLYYQQATGGVGWYIDNVRGTGLTTVTAEAPTPIGATSFDLTPIATGTLMLQARPGRNGYFAEWGLVKTIPVVKNRMDCFFNWVEAQYPALGRFTGAGRFEAYYYRYYPVNGGIYVAQYSPNDHVYYQDGQGVHEIGTTAQALGFAGCPI